VKQYTSRFLKTVAAFLIVFPVAYIVIAAMLFDIPMNACAGILLSPFYYIVTFSAVAAGYGLWEMRRWSWYFLVASQVLVAYENAIFVLNYAESHHKFLAFFTFILIQMGLVYRVAREIRVPYFFPRIRWWESNPRYRLSIPVVLAQKNGEPFAGEILDLSMAGCFVKLRVDVRQDDLLSVKFKAYGYDLQCWGKAVWVAQSAVTHPKGIGIKFEVLSKSQRRAFRSIGRRLRKISNHYRRSRYLMSQEDFLKGLEQIEKNEQTQGQNADDLRFQNGS
jgi:hypothetical protein